MSRHHNKFVLFHGVYLTGSDLLSVKVFLVEFIAGHEGL